MWYNKKDNICPTSGKNIKERFMEMAYGELNEDKTMVLCYKCKRWMKVRRQFRGGYYTYYMPTHTANEPEKYYPGR